MSWDGVRDAPLLEVECIDVFYNGLQALFNVSLRVEEGEIVTLLGSNGAGKTTLLKAISGLVRPASGSVRFLGSRIDKLRASEIVARGISQVPAGRRLFPRMTVLENLELGARSREAQMKMEDTLQLAYDIFPVLKERRNQLARTLSGGEQQMVAMARSLMSRPRLWLLDEPSYGLAPMLVAKTLETIKRVNTQGVTVLLAAQDVRGGLETANRAYLLANGRVTLEGESSQLLVDKRIRQAYMGL